MEQPGLSGGDFTNSRTLYHGAASYCQGKKVFDFGCGQGHGPYFLTPYVLNILGFDQHQPSIDTAKELFASPTCQYTSNFTQASDDSYDIVVSIEAIEHLEKEDLVVKLEEFSKMAPEIYVTTPNGNFFPYQPKTPAERRGYHVWHYTQQELEDLFGNFYSYVFVHGVLRDPNPRVNQFVGYAVFASNKLRVSDNFKTDYRDRLER